MLSHENLFPEEIIQNSPSKCAGVTWEIEKNHRIFGCEIIQEGGILLKLPQVVMATGQSIFHRFFYRLQVTSNSSIFLFE